MAGSGDARSARRRPSGERNRATTGVRPGGVAAGTATDPIAVRLARLGALKPKVSVSAPSIGVTAPSLAVPSLNFSPLSILRNGNDFTLAGILPDLSVKNSLLATLKSALGPSVNLIDKIDVEAGATAPTSPA